ncbi:trans-sialidase, putative, partial [Trypanosoma cruzi marinkellei]
YSAVLLLVVAMMCCGTCGAAAAEGNDGKSDLRNFQKQQRVDLFVPRTTPVLLKDKTSSEMRFSFVSPSLVSAAGVIAAFAEGHMKAKNLTDAQSLEPIPSDIVAGYIDSSWDWTTLVDKVNQSTWKAHTVLSNASVNNRLVGMLNPTTTTKGNKVFLLAESSELFDESGNLIWDKLDLTLVVGTVTNSTGGEPSGRISWENPKSLSSLKTSAASHESKFERVFPSGGSGVLMEGGTLVFPLFGYSDSDVDFSTIIYSTDDGQTWMLSNGTSPEGCSNPRITEWEGSLLMLVDCKDGQRVYESRDMGTTWTGTIGTLPGVWTKSKSIIWDVSLHVDSLITATIEERKV